MVSPNSAMNNSKICTSGMSVSRVDEISVCFSDSPHAPWEMQFIENYNIIRFVNLNRERQAVTPESESSSETASYEISANKSGCVAESCVSLDWSLSMTG